MSERRIEDYALIGDGETAALVHRSGSIEWLCFPRFDSEACCAALLGDRENGCWEMTIEGAVGEPSRRYRGDSLILETEIACDEGRVRITDFMPIRGEAPDVVRIVECLQGRAEVTSELLLRFDYGRIHPLVREASDGRLVAISGPDGVSLDFDAPIEFEERRFTSRFSLSEGERSRFVLTWFPSHECVPDRVDPDKALAHTKRFWKDWVSKAEYDGEHRGAVVRSMITLKALIHRPTGGMVAAPTASLPEHFGGSRNWDYRYCWLRDATLTLLALVRMGLREEASAWINWLRRAAGGEPLMLQPFYTVMGDHRAFEWEANWLCGFANSRPVRFGNRAEKQLQLDIYGQVIDALYQAHAEGIGTEDDDTDKLIRLLAGKLEEIWREPDAGIWESRGPPRHHTYSKIMCWVAFDRAADWFSRHDSEMAERYERLAEEVREQVFERGFDPKRNCFVAAYGETDLDAALLRIPHLKFLPADDERMIGTVAAIEAELCSDGLVRRYLPERFDDGLEGDEGAFVAACFWLADVYHMQGRTGDAQALCERLIGRMNDLGLLAEQLSYETGEQCGNFPQGLSHLALLASAHILSQGSDFEHGGGGV